MYSIVRSLVCALRTKQHVQKVLHQKVVRQFTVSRINLVTSTVSDDSDELIDEICKGDSTLEKRLRVLMLEVEVMRQDGRNAPNRMQKRHWEHLLTLRSNNQRSSYLLYLFKNEKSNENEKARKEARRRKFEEEPPEDLREYSDDLNYGIKDQSLFLRIRDTSINKFDNYRALQAITHGQPIVLDCSYEQHMVYKETINAAKQVTFVFGDNRLHRDPFDLHLCNVNMAGDFMKQIERNIPNIKEPWVPLHLHTQSYLDIFPKDKLVYLTPHCREELTEYDHDAIYIVGCMVDKANNEPFSLAKAKRDGIKMAKLPLDRYLEWSSGAKKNLNVNHIVPIMLDLKLYNDWEFALRHVPRRKLMQTQIYNMSKNIRNKNLRMDMKNMFQSDQKPNYTNKRKWTRKSLYYDDDDM